MKILTNRINTLLLAFILIFTVSCNNDGDSNVQLPGIDGPTVKLKKDEVRISALFSNIEISQDLYMPIPSLDYSYLSIEGTDKGVALDISLSLQDILGDDAQTLPAQTLPGGRALPGVASGTLPATAFTVPKFNNMTFYVGNNIFGAFIPAEIGLSDGTIATFRYYVKGKRNGNISLVGADENGENEGFLLLLELTKKQQKYLKRLKRKYARD